MPTASDRRSELDGLGTLLATREMPLDALVFGDVMRAADEPVGVELNTLIGWMLGIPLNS